MAERNTREDEQQHGSPSPSPSDAAHLDTAHDQSHQTSGGGAAGRSPKFGFFSDVKSFLLDSPDKRKAHKAAKAAQEAGLPPVAGQPGGGDAGGSSHTPRRATAVAPTTAVSRRARLLGGHRGRVVLMQLGILILALLTVLNLVLVLTRPSKDDIATEVAGQLREQGQDFPSGQAVAWADQVVVDWGTWNQNDRDERRVRMAQYLTSGMDEQAGWNGKGTQKVTFTSPDPDPTVIDENRALVNVDYRLDDQSRRCVAVPVYAYQAEGVTGPDPQWAFALAGNPIPRPCAPRTGAKKAPTENEDKQGLGNDQNLGSDLTENFFPGFFSAWAASDANALKQYTASGVTTIGLGGAMTSTPPPDIESAKIWTPRTGEPAEGTIYPASVTVTWTVAGSDAQIEASYDVPMKKVGDRWYVAGEPVPATSSDVANSGYPNSKVDPDSGADSQEGSDDTSDASDGGGE